MRRLLILALLLAVTLRAETPADVYSDRRKDLQGQFARAQKAIYQDPAKATEADIAEMVKVNAAINALKTDFLGFEQARVAVDSLMGGESYERAWSRATRDFRMLTSGLVRAASSPLRPLIVPAASRIPRVYGAVVERLAR